MQEEERRHKDKYESVHLSLLLAKKQNKDKNLPTTPTRNKSGHMKKECSRYAT